MAADILRELKGVNFSCASPAASTAAEQHCTVLMTSDAGSSGGRAIDRFSPHLRDPLRARSLNPPDQPIQTPSSPKVHHTAAATTTTTATPKKTASKKSKEKRPSQRLVSPASSSRYLLGESASTDDTSAASHVQPAGTVVTSDTWRLETAKVQEPPTKAVVVKQEEPLQSINMEQTTTTNEASSSSAAAAAGSTRPQNHQVVVLRVSLHCKGCEGKVRKHLSKMEGVTSFATDLVSKKVTVIGDVTPLGVLNSISKVKNAQLW